MPATDTTTPKETWIDWIPDDFRDPAIALDDDELITRDELLRRVRALGPDIHPRTLQVMEKQGLAPRPIRRWHEDAVRALYAPWVVEIVTRAHDLRRQRLSKDEALEHVRAYAIGTYLGSNVSRDSELRIPDETLKQLQAIGYRHTRFIAPIAAVEIHFLDAKGDVVAAHHHDYPDVLIAPHYDYSADEEDAEQFA